ncbi:MAG TPA: fused MFS/spermidine synthase [Miltoncostaeaceae bacterium]|jgi:spermidine synthase|nr:fused MFS/spermidine synthase [Miltoncostaeaceae bacterium]
MSVSSPTAAPRPPRAAADGRLVLVVVFVVGAASLGTEIAAARLLAPWFGASTIIWANTIATVLVALSAGYWLGGRLADRGPSLRGLSLLTLAAGVLLAVVPFVSGPFLRTSVEAFDEISVGAFVGSLVAVCALVAVPVVLLGTVSPYAIRLTVASVEEAGRVSGRLYAISTLGSLLGVFLAALVLIPFAGTRRTFLVFAVALGLVSLIGLPRRAALAPLACAALLLLPVGVTKATGTGRVIWEKETQYGYARVLERDDGSRRLELNEGQATHSVYHPGTYLTGNYWDEFLVLPLASGRAPRSIAILGDAAGTTARAYGHYYPAARVDGVEIDGALHDVGRRLFDLRGPDLHLHTADARPFLRTADRRWDAIVVDAYRQPYIPFYLVTKEFFQEVHDHLEPGGTVMVNVGHPEGSDRLEEVLAATMGTAFAHVMRDPSEDINTILVASDAPLSGDALRAAAAPAGLQEVQRAAGARLAPALTGGEVYTDDRAPVEWLIDASIVEVAAEGG